MNATAATGSKEEHERALKLLREFFDLLKGEDPSLDSEEQFRERWGTTSDAQQGQRAMLAMPGVAGFVLDEDGSAPRRLLDGPAVPE